MSDQRSRKGNQANNNRKQPATYGERIKDAIQAAAGFVKGLVGRK